MNTKQQSLFLYVITSQLINQLMQQQGESQKQKRKPVSKQSFDQYQFEMKIKSTNSQSISLNIPEKSQSGHPQPYSPRLSEIKSVKSLIRQQPRPTKTIELRHNNSKKQFYRGSLHDESIEVKEMSQNLIVIEEERKSKKLQYQYQMLKALPVEISNHYSQLPVSSRVNLKYVQQISLFTNYIKSFKEMAFEKLTYLRELDLNENMISQIPHQAINEHLVSLQILKLNSNEIAILPYLKHIKHLELLQNPLKNITKKLVSMNLTLLEIDWMEYLTLKTSETIKSQKSSLTQKHITSKMSVQSKRNTSQMTPLQILKYEYIKKLNSQPQTTQDYYDFKTIFKLKVHKISTSNLQETITQLLSTVIEKEHSFFVDFLLKYFPNLHYNKMNLYNKFLLENALHIRNTHFSQYVMKLFKPQKWPYQGTYPFLDNLFIAIRNSAVVFVQYLIQLEIAVQILDERKQEILQFLLTEFRQTSQGVYIAGAICLKIFDQSNSENMKDAVEISLAKFPLSKSRVIMNFWNFIARNQKLKPFILFTKRQNYYENSFLHFAMKSHEPQTTIQLMLQTKNKLDLFLKNSLGQSAKCQFAGDKLCKRVMWQLQKKYLKIHSVYNHQTQTDIRLLDIKVEKKLQVPYVKLSRIRTKNLKEIIKLLGLDCHIMKGILNNCVQNQYLQSEQEVYFVLQQILQKLDRINFQLKFKDKTLSTHEFYVIIMKLLQTEIYDKRCYLAAQIGKLLCRKKEDKIIFSLQEIAMEDDSRDQLNYTDNQLLIEYELLHSIPLLKSQNFMVSSSASKNSNYQILQSLQVWMQKL